MVTIVMTGFFSPEDIARFVAARDAAHTLLRCGPNEHLTLVDIRGMRIQSQESVELFRSVLKNPRVQSRRLAIVVAQSLARMQIKRAASDRDPAYFTEPAEAEAWLVEDLATDAATDASEALWRT
ncbi:hypothetical protein [Sphingomonas sp. TDK1]|uniref:hypothetical protein n=1 Tax=Sphingomonas sp. TDK1 TaxID=453247 RepID=UPI0012ECCAC4|nr:hypothetical protein [Sphingomonas sp. TDK1]